MKSNDDIILFYTKDDFLSNFYVSTFFHNGIMFRTTEKAIMYRKAMLFGDRVIADRILKTYHPIDAKRLGRKVRNFNEAIWELNKLEIFREVILDKFSNKYLKIRLLDTGDRILAEASPTDKIWGIGLDENHEDAFNPSKWKGKNLLGQVLMDVRSELKSREENSFSKLK